MCIRDRGATAFGAHELGLVFFGWGLALAITSVLVAPVLTRRFGLRPVLSVSYTHLDVYKRQLSRPGNSSEGLRVATYFGMAS